MLCAAVAAILNNLILCTVPLLPGVVVYKVNDLHNNVRSAKERRVAMLDIALVFTQIQSCYQNNCFTLSRKVLSAA